jgi:hypothetical protein
MDIYNKTKQTLKETNRQIISQGLGMISSALILVAALAWNEAIKELITTYLKNDSGLISRFLYAIIVTVIAVIITMRINTLASKYKNEDNQK